MCCSELRWFFWYSYACKAFRFFKSGLMMILDNSWTRNKAQKRALLDLAVQIRGPQGEQLSSEIVCTWLQIANQKKECNEYTGLRFSLFFRVLAPENRTKCSGLHRCIENKEMCSIQKQSGNVAFNQQKTPATCFGNNLLRSGKVFCTEWAEKKPQPNIGRFQKAKWDPFSFVSCDDSIFCADLWRAFPLKKRTRRKRVIYERLDISR